MSVFWWPTIGRFKEFCLRWRFFIWVSITSWLKVELSCLIGFKWRRRFVICDLKSCENGIRLTVNAYISQYRNGFNVIQIGRDILLKEHSNDMSYANSAEKRKSYTCFTKHCRTGISPNRWGRGTSAWLGALSELWSGIHRPTGIETSASLNLMTYWSVVCRSIWSSDRDFDAGMHDFFPDFVRSILLSLLGFLYVIKAPYLCSLYTQVLSSSILRTPYNCSLFFFLHHSEEALNSLTHGHRFILIEPSKSLWSFYLSFFYCFSHPYYFND